MQARKTLKTLALIPALLIAGVAMAQTPAAPAATPAPAAASAVKAEGKTAPDAAKHEHKKGEHKKGTHKKAAKPAEKASEAAK